MPNPGACCDAGPVSNVEIGTARHACATLKERGRGTGARSQPADADCGTEFTPLTCVLCPQRASSTVAVHPQIAAGAFRTARERAELGRCESCALLVAVGRAAAPRRRAPTTAGWTGRCGPDRRSCGPSTRRAPNWNRGHRGVDLAGAPGQPVYAAAAGTVVFAGELAGRPLVSIAHPGGLRTSYEPVSAAVRAGQLVDAGSRDRRAGRRPSRLRCRGVPALGCDVGPGRAGRLRRPAGLLATTPIRLKPLGG